MSWLKKIFYKETSISTYSEFWDWFSSNEKKFYDVIKKQGNIQKTFFDKLSPKLDQLRDGYWFLVGMCDKNTVELILTADGDIRNIVFVEELVDAAPKMKGWKITALKQESTIGVSCIEMAGFKFDETTMSFYSNNSSQYPDEINITITHIDLNENNRADIINGSFLLLDNTLGELRSVTTIDNIEFINTNEAKEDLVPLEKLKDFLVWREKEFVEKYDDVRYNTNEDSYSGMEAILKNGFPLLAIINSDLLEWDSKASHPWIANLTITYKGKDTNGMPNKLDYDLMNSIEEELMNELKDYEGYLNIGRQTANGSRDIYFACKDFRKPSKLFDSIKLKYVNTLKIDFEIYKDKYWRTLERFKP